MNGPFHAPATLPCKRIAGCLLKSWAPQPVWTSPSQQSNLRRSGPSLGYYTDHDTPAPLHCNSQPVNVYRDITTVPATTFWNTTHYVTKYSPVNRRLSAHFCKIHFTFRAHLSLRFPRSLVPYCFSPKLKVRFRTT